MRLIKLFQNHYFQACIEGSYASENLWLSMLLLGELESRTILTKCNAFKKCK